jgi:alanine racemase
MRVKDARIAGAILTIDLGALAANWRRLAARAAPAECAAVVKADGYGLGIVPVAKALAKAGCKTFFVAHASEGLALRDALPTSGAKSRVFVLHGAPAGAERDFIAQRLIPVLSSLEQVAVWRRNGRRAPAALHFDTGMNRLGIGAREAEKLLAGGAGLAGIDVRLVMSHLACADEPGHPMNPQQLRRFDDLRRRLPGVAASLANSAGIYLGPAYHHQMVRAGVALYGPDPLPGGPREMKQVVQLHGRILQVRDVDRGMTVGYGATHSLAGPGRVATVPVGYGDGFLRSLSNRGFGFLGDKRIDLVGRVSMDLITLDVTAVPPDRARPGALVELIGPHAPLTEIAERAGTIPYEILVRLGRRFHRVYRAAPATRRKKNARDK